MNRTFRLALACALGVSLAAVAEQTAAGTGQAEELLRKSPVTGGLVVQVGIASDANALGLADLQKTFHVRLLDIDPKLVAAARKQLATAGLHGRSTAGTFDGRTLPFPDGVVNALVVVEAGQVAAAEMQRVLASRGLLVRRDNDGWSATTKPVPEATDEWTHYLYDASGNAVSKDQHVGPPRSFRWRAGPLHMRSHNYGASFAGLVSAEGRMFHLLDEGTYLFDRGGATERWSLVARDAFNGALLWKRPLVGYGQPYFEDVSGQPVPDYIWRSPLSLNRRLVMQGGRLYAALRYRRGPLSILDAATGRTLCEIDLGGIVDEIVAHGTRVVCRVRAEIPPPAKDLMKEHRWATQQALKRKGVPGKEVRSELDGRIMDSLRGQKAERIVAVDAETGKVLWKHAGPRIAVQSLAMAGGKVVFHNYETLVALDAATGKPAWTYACPVQKRRRLGPRNLLGNLLIAEGKVLWTSSATGGGVCLDLADGKQLWTDPRAGTTGGFGFPTAQRVIRGVVYRDSVGGPMKLSDGSRASMPDVGGMLTRGHHIRCFPGKATTRYLILPHRGAEFIDLAGDGHMVHDWLRGGCSLGNMPANGLFYVTPDCCVCYAGARIYGFSALAAISPADANGIPAPTSPTRLTRGPAYGRATTRDPRPEATAWPMYRHDARRTGAASCPMSADLKIAWKRSLGATLTQATVAVGKAYVVDRDAYELHCLEAASGKTLWRRAFAAELDGPPTLHAGRLFIGCRDGTVHCLDPTDGEVAWRFLAAPLERLTLDRDRLASVWPVSSSVLAFDGAIYAVAGRNSYLDGGIHVYALDPATGAVRHHRRLEGPRPDSKTLREPVVTERDIKKLPPDSPKRAEAVHAMQAEYATGYNMHGAEADLLVTDGNDLYMTQTKLTPALEPVPLKRIFHTGLTPMGGMHMLANAGFLDETMFHRSYWMYDRSWPGYGGGSGWAARAGTMVALGATRAYAAKHYKQGWYPTHEPGSGNRLVADGFDHDNTAGPLAGRETNRRFRQYGSAAEIVRTGAPLWETTLPIIVRAMLVVPTTDGGELVFTAGIVEGTDRKAWDRSTYYEGPGKLLVHDGANGKLLGGIDLSACPAFDGLSAAGGRLLVSLVSGDILAYDAAMPAPARH